MARTPSERQGSLDTLYKEACDPSTSPSRLAEIWSETKSTKIRKAIASNLNCDPQTMKLASRLYVEEVIKNGSFQLLKTFDEDPFVLGLDKAYNSPNSISLYGYKTEDRLHIAKAALISPKLSSLEKLSDICSILGKTDFVRILKDKDVFNRVSSISKTMMSQKRNSSSEHRVLGTLNFLESCSVVSCADIAMYLKLLNRGMQYFSAGSVKKTFFKLNKDPSNYENLYWFFRAMSDDRIRGSLSPLFEKDKSMYSDEMLKLFSDLHLDNLYAHYTNTFKQYRVSAGRRHSSHANVFGKLALKAIFYRRVHNRPIDEVDFYGIRDDIVKFNLAGLGSCEVQSSKLSRSSWKTAFCETESVNIGLTFAKIMMGIEDDDLLVFLITRGIFPNEWFTKSNIDNWDGRLINRLNAINFKLFKESGETLFKYSNLQTFPSITVSQYEGASPDLVNSGRIKPEELSTHG